MATTKRKLTGDADFQRLLLCRMLKAVRLGRCQGLAEVAEATGIAHSTISLIENGHRDPSLGTVLMLCDYYGLVFDLNPATDRDEKTD